MKTKRSTDYLDILKEKYPDISKKHLSKIIKLFSGSMFEALSNGYNIRFIRKDFIFKVSTLRSFTSINFETYKKECVKHKNYRKTRKKMKKYE